MKALISPNELIPFFDGSTGIRIAQVEPEDFPVADPLFWVDCPDDVKAETHYWTGNDFAVQLDPPSLVEVEMPIVPTMSTGTIPVEIL